MKKTVLMTGANGVIGTLLRRELEKTYTLRLLALQPIAETETIIADIGDLRIYESSHDAHRTGSVTFKEYQEGVLLMSCGLKSEWCDKLIKSSVTPMESQQLLRWKITPHISKRQAKAKVGRFFYKLFGGVLYSDCEWQPHSLTRDTYEAGQGDRRG